MYDSEKQHKVKCQSQKQAKCGYHQLFGHILYQFCLMFFVLFLFSLLFFSSLAVKLNEMSSTSNTKHVMIALEIKEVLCLITFATLWLNYKMQLAYFKSIS